MPVPCMRHMTNMNRSTCCGRGRSSYRSIYEQLRKHICMPALSRSLYASRSHTAAVTCMPMCSQCEERVYRPNHHHQHDVHRRHAASIARHHAGHHTLIAPQPAQNATNACVYRAYDPHVFVSHSQLSSVVLKSAAQGVEFWSSMRAEKKE